MITEIATIVIDPAGRRVRGRSCRSRVPFPRRRGLHAMALDRCIEHPGRYFLRVEWESVDHHMVRFRASEAFQHWRALAGPFFAEPPVAVHSERAITCF